MMEKIGFGIVGTNFISDYFLDAISLTKKARAVAIYSRTAENGRSLAEKHGIKKVYTNYIDMLNDSDINAVYVASPTMLHKEHSMEAFFRAKHVLCEKMIAVNYQEFSKMKAAAKGNSRVLLEAMRPDFDPLFSILEEKLKSIGIVKEAHFEFAQYSSRYDNFKRGIVENAFNPKMKNSALSDIGVYPLHLAVRLFGMPNDLKSESRFLDNGFEAEGKLNLSYKDFDLHIFYSKIREGKNASYIKCEDGFFEFDKINAPNFLRYVRFSDRSDITFYKQGNNILAETEAFCDAVNGDLNLSDKLDISEKTMLLIDKIYESSKISFD